MSRSRRTYRAGRRRAPVRNRSARPSMWHGRVLLTVVILLIIWAHWKGQA